MTCLRFTHNEIERKRRARLKSETDFLHQQLPKAIYRDKLAIFKAGTDLLLRYSNSNDSEARNLILTDSEYSECVLNNFEGFGLRIRCSDGLILMATKSWNRFLGSGYTTLTGKKINDLVYPGELTEEIIEGNLSLTSEERDQLACGQPIARSFILPFIDKSSCALDISAAGSLFECCGDIVLSSSSNQSENEPVLQAVCRSLEHNFLDPTVPKNKLFSLRLQPDSHLIVEFHGHAMPTGFSSSDMVGHSLVDLITPTSRSIIESSLCSAKKNGEATFTICFKVPSSDCTQLPQFLVVTKAISVCDCLQCLVADFYPPH